MPPIYLLCLITWPFYLMSIIANNYPKSPHSYYHAHPKPDDAPSKPIIALNVIGDIVAVIGMCFVEWTLTIAVFIPSLLLSTINLVTIFKLRRQAHQYQITHSKRS